ncbi:MAG: PIN domain-containing protein [Nanoarchaeota archaeon]
MRRIIIDTNMLLVPIQFKLDIFNQINQICTFNYDLCIVDKTITELDQIIQQGKLLDRRAARVAKLLVEQKKVKILDTTNTKADDAITELSKPGIIIATNDRLLKQRAKQKGAQILTLRQKKYLMLE